MLPNSFNFNYHRKNDRLTVFKRAVGLSKIMKITVILLSISSVIMISLLQEKTQNYSSNNIQYSAFSELWDTDVNPLLILETKRETTIAVIDTGVDFNSSFLENSQYIKANLSSENKISDNHGTKVAGIIAGQGEEYKGLLPGENLISINYGDTKTDLKHFIEAIDTAISYLPDVINISAGTNKDDPELHAVIKKASELGIIVIAASGNTSSDDSEYPAAYDEVLAVGAVDKNRKITNFSSRSDKIDVYAPGYKVKTIVGNSIVDFSGTSAAVPFVSGLVAILKAIDPSLDSHTVKRIIEKSSDEVIQEDKTIKIINYENAIRMIIEEGLKS